LQKIRYDIIDENDVLYNNHGTTSMWQKICSDYFSSCFRKITD